MGIDNFLGEEVLMFIFLLIDFKIYYKLVGFGCLNYLFGYYNFIFVWVILILKII